MKMLWRGSVNRDRAKYEALWWDKKVSKKGCESKKICRICACTAGVKCEWGEP